MNNLGLLLNLGVGLAVGIGVNWLADWLPYFRSTVTPPPGKAGWRRGGGVLLISILFAVYLHLSQLFLRAASPAGTWLLWLCFALFLLILVIDLEHRRVLNIVVYPMAVISLALLPLRPDLTFSSALLGGAVGFAIFFALFLLRPGGMGAGDVKLAGLIGLLIGFPGVLVALVSAIILGGVAALLLLIFRRVGLRGTMAYAPYLSIGAMTALIYGQTIVSWYLERLGVL
ncbi:MAG: A24 family peptidase [Caldilineaceae bacterium]|nr:A24 family peptidase [Caldilineaceae bacterium]HRJ42752.1 A24 family peptidase [Caldilineaceae bacterium]